jgi:hypothetical protein
VILYCPLSGCKPLYQWLPDDKNECLIRQVDNITARLWIDKNCVNSLTPVDEENIRQWVNIPVNKVHVDITIADVCEELAAFIHDERERPRNIHHGISPDHEEYLRLSCEYEVLGLKVLKVALETYNRFIRFARNNKSQYWLHERPFEENQMPSMNNSFHTTVYLEDCDGVRWCPPGTDVITFEFYGEETSIKREEWNQFKEFVGSNSRPDLILELLANAQLLIDEGHGRSAIIEAVSALEIAVSSFSKKGKLDRLVTNDLLSRFDASQLQSQVKHMGFSGSLSYLFPILFPDEVLPIKILKHCQEVIQLRNNIVHNGQRDVVEKEARSLVASVRQTCEIITQYIDIESH